MKRFGRWAHVCLCAALFAGCATSDKRHYGTSEGLTVPATEAAGAAEAQSDRMMIWTAEMSLEVGSVSNAVDEVAEVAQRHGGYIERKHDWGGKSARMTVRVPVRSFLVALADFEALGTVINRTIEGRDVTDQFTDAEAWLKNKIVLRERLKLLLDKATDVKDALAIEAELNRVQGEIDVMEGRIKSLKGHIAYATVTLELDRKPILGPVGYIFRGLWRGIGKLFVIRD